MGLFRTIKTGFKLGCFATKVLGGVAISSLRGLNTALEITSESLDKVNNKDWKGLGNTLERRSRQICVALDNKFQALGEFGNAVEQSIATKDLNSLLTKENSKRAVVALGTGLAAIGVSAGIADGLDDIDTPPSDFMPGSLGFIGSDLIPIDNGIFIGNDAELNNLIEAGEFEGTTHIDSEDIVRDIGARDAFLQAHGFSEVPNGYEVHHVVPLSEGGSDTASNMVLVTEAQHAVITAAHADFYGWHD